MTAAASSGEAVEPSSSSWGRRLGKARHDGSFVRTLSADDIFAAVDATTAIDRVRDAFVKHHRGEWVMPSKVYLDSPPHGDFRAMPALGGELALLKWITSFPGNPEQGLPTVSGVVCLSDRRTGVPLALLDARAVTALRTGAVAAVATRA